MYLKVAFFLFQVEYIWMTYGRQYQLCFKREECNSSKQLSGFAGNHICHVCVLFCVGNIFALFVFCIVENILALFVFCFVKPCLPYLCLYCGKHIGLVFLKMRLFTHQQYNTSTKKVLWDLFWSKKEYITSPDKKVLWDLFWSKKEYITLTQKGVKNAKRKKHHLMEADDETKGCWFVSSWWWDKRLLICEKLLMLLCWLRKSCWWRILMISKKVISKSDHSGQNEVDLSLKSGFDVVFVRLSQEKQIKRSGLTIEI